MTIKNVQWVTGDQVILTKQTGMTDDITNDVDNIHTQYGPLFQDFAFIHTIRINIATITAEKSVQTSYLGGGRVFPIEISASLLSLGYVFVQFAFRFLDDFSTKKLRVVADGKSGGTDSGNSVNLQLVDQSQAVVDSPNGNQTIAASAMSQGSFGALSWTDIDLSGLSSGDLLMASMAFLTDSSPPRMDVKNIKMSIV